MADRCQATILMRDDRWGGFVDRCDLNAGHEGEHRTARDACEPTAWLCWTGTYERPAPRPPDSGEARR